MNGLCAFGKVFALALGPIILLFFTNHEANEKLFQYEDYVSVVVIFWQDVGIFYFNDTNMLEQAQLEWSFAQVLLPPFIKSSSSDDESIYFSINAPVMGVHFVFQHY